MQETMRENVGSLLPMVTEFEKPFWDGMQDGVLLVQKCPACGNVQFPPSPVCTACLSDKVEWKPCSGKAKLWSKVTFHKAYLKPYNDVPYSVGLAKLTEGPIMTGRLTVEDAKNMKLDDPLSITFEESRDGTKIVVLRPVK